MLTTTIVKNIARVSMANLNFDELIHAPLRLKICAFLSPTKSVAFPVLRDALDVSDSVLSKHIKQLESAGYVKQEKGSENGRKRSWICMTMSGRKAYKNHINELQKIIESSGTVQE